MASTAFIQTPTFDFIHNLPVDQVPAFIADQQKNRSLTAVVKELNTALLNGRREHRESARVALEKLGFIDV